MSYVIRTYEFLEKLEKLFNKKIFKTALVAVFSMFLFFGVMNVYAQEDNSPVVALTSTVNHSAAESTDTDMIVTPDWDGIKEFCNSASSVSNKLDSKEDNMTSSLCMQFTNTLWGLFMGGAPDLTGGREFLAESSSIPKDLKLGLLGTSDMLIASAYENQPNVNVVAHLQEEWVPGYDASNTALYADDGSVPGYQSLMDSGIAPIWSQMRNLAYVFFVVIMIVIGFMIMFRSKIGGQTLVGIGNTIPSVIISLILVTFSFAIAGVIIDIGGVLVSLIFSILGDKAHSIQNIGGLMSVLFNGLGTQAVDAMKDEWANMVSTVTTPTLGGVLKIMSLLGWTVGTGGAAPAAVGAFALILLVIAIGIVFVGAVKLIIALYKAYFQILLSVILGPIQIMISTIPGQEAMRTNWLLSIARNVLVFPIVYFIVNIPIYLTQVSGDMLLNFPSKLTGNALGNTGTTVGLTQGVVGLLFMFVFRVFVLYYAAQAPKFAEIILPPVMTNASKASADAMANAKMSLGKIPLIGSLFGK